MIYKNRDKEELSLRGNGSLDGKKENKFLNNILKLAKEAATCFCTFRKLSALN